MKKAGKPQASDQELRDRDQHSLVVLLERCWEDLAGSKRARAVGTDLVQLLYTCLAHLCYNVFWGSLLGPSSVLGVCRIQKSEQLEIT